MRDFHRAKLRFGVKQLVESRLLYSVYVDRDGHHHYLPHGRVTLDHTVDLAELWSDWPHAGYVAYVDGQREVVVESFRQMVEDVFTSGWADELEQCHDCAMPRWRDDMFYTNDNEAEVCEVCIQHYTTCSGCDDRVRNTTCTLTGAYVCSGCLEEAWTFCGICDGWRHDTDYSHDHSTEDCCASPALEFAIRNDGCEPLRQDERVMVTLPSGVISQRGMERIADAIRRLGSDHEDLVYEESNPHYQVICVANRIDEVGPQWQAKDGNFTKRLQRFAYKAYKLKLPPALISEVGNIASEESRGRGFSIEVTRDLNQPRENFVHSGSCWWGEYNESRCALKTNGGFGLRTFDQHGPVGRAWVMPLVQVPGDGRLVPTFDTLTPDAFMVFNGYGDLEGYAPARILAHMAGWTYRKIAFECGPMYVNNESGYLVASEEIAAPYTDGSLRLSVQYHSSLFEDEEHDRERELNHA